MQMNLYTIIPEDSEGDYFYVIANTFSEAEKVYLSKKFHQKINVIKRHYIIIPKEEFNKNLTNINLYKVIIQNKAGIKQYMYLAGENENVVADSYNPNNKTGDIIISHSVFLEDIVFCKGEVLNEN